MDRTVAITVNGRAGVILYREGANALRFDWEFGGGDAVAVITAGDDAWWERNSWAVPRRAEILRFVADEVIRQKAPNCRAEIDERGWGIVLRQTAPLPKRESDGARWVLRLRSLRLRLAIAVLIGAIGVVAALWVRDAVFTINPGKGTAVGLAVRTDRHIAALIQTLEPYTPSLNRDHGKDTYRLGILLVPLDGSAAKLMPIKGGLSANSISLAKILGSDGRTLWFNAAGIGGVDLAAMQLLPEKTVAQVDARVLPGPSTHLPMGPKLEHHLAAGLYTSPTTWLGLHSDEEVARHFKPKASLKRVVRAESGRQLRRLHKGILDPDTSAGYQRILSMTPLSDTVYPNAAFLRMDDASEPLRLGDPASALAIFNADPGLKAAMVAARIDMQGAIVWRADTGIDRFALRQILPGVGSTAFVGTRPREEGKVPEPLLVIVEHATGGVRTESLWR